MLTGSQQGCFAEKAKQAVAVQSGDALTTKSFHFQSIHCLSRMRWTEIGTGNIKIISLLGPVFLKNSKDILNFYCQLDKIMQNFDS
jgi:hypothetical protein